MKTPFHSCSKPVRFLGVALSLAMSLATVGVLVMPAVAFAASSNPAVDQEPLTVQPTVPPNIMLMLDDSGSMTWDVMPDYGSLSDTSADGLTDSDVNGVYFNPTVTYTIPPQADGTSYTTPSFGSAPINGFDPTGTTVDIAQYRGQYDSYNVNYYGTPVPYSVGVAKTGASTYKPANSCPSNTALSGGAQPGYCYYTDQNNIPTGPVSFFDKGNGYFYVSRCNSVGDIYSYAKNNKDTCTPGLSFFIYTTTNSGGGYTRHYVGENTGDCAAAGLASSVCDDSDSVRQNVANWFSYYHTRILMAKTGLMSGFSTLSSKYRFGFGSINGNNDSNLPSPTGTYGSNNNKIAKVQPFGNGAANTQKAYFWNWVKGEKPGSSTPLRRALQAVGKYYQTKQPWDSTPDDPGYSSTGSNAPLACRAAYTILTTDGFWNGGTPSSIGNADGTNGTTVTGPNGQSYTYNAAAPYSDNNSDTLADVAMYYWETDLQDGSGSSYNLANEVPTSTEDPAFWQHMTTFTMGLGYKPVNIAPSGTTTDQIFDWANGGTAISGFSWPTPGGDSINNIADLVHAGVNGHGAFFSATSPQAFTAGIQSALKRVSERVGTGASLAANSTSLTTGTVIYQANYYTSVWKGDLKAFSVNATTGAISTTPTWQASNQMPTAANRTIETYNTTTGKFVAFKNGTSSAPSLSSAQLTALGATATEQQAIVNYLRGDASGEEKNGGPYRSRDTALGDVVHSQPVYSGIPDVNEFINQSFLGTITDSSGTIPYYVWAVGTTNGSGKVTPSAVSTRSPLIFVTANDGMLHAFNATTGAEVFAYLPGAVITAGIKGLSDPSYGQSSDPHQFFNDGQLTIADAYIDTGDGNGQSWHTILVGTTGLGLARTVFALDITDPSSITPLWERSAGDGKAGSDYIGQMVGKPVIAQTNYTPKSGATAASSTWSVLIGNGYNSANGVAALLQFNLADGTLSVHKTDGNTGNGLAAPLAWMDAPTNGVSDIAYAGDDLGRVWSFALNDITGANADLNSNGQLLFTARDSGGKAQPITAGMLAGTNPVTGDVWLFFGTGQYLSNADLSNIDTQTWYGIIVQSNTPNIVSNLANGRSALTQRTITNQTAASGSTLAGRSVSSQVTNSDGTNDMTGKSGWYMDLLAPIGAGGALVKQGERMIDPNQFQGSVLIGVTRIPEVTDVCNPSGTGWIMALDPFTGTGPLNDFFDINGDGSINSGDRVSGGVAAGVGFGSLPNAPIFVGGAMETSFDNGTNSTIGTAGSTGVTKRVSWRELVNP